MKYLRSDEIYNLNVYSLKMHKKEEKFEYVCQSMHNICAYFVGNAQKITVFVQTINELKKKEKNQ